MGNPELRNDEEDEVKLSHPHHKNIPEHYEIMSNKEMVSPNKLATFLRGKEGEAFLQEDNCEVGCMDGRVMANGALGLAGSGILLPRDPVTDLPKQEYLDNLAAMAKEGKLTKLTWHRGHGGCGAAKLALKAVGNANPSEEEIGWAAKDFAVRLGKKLSEMSGKKIKVEEAAAEGHHGERGAYIDMTNRLDLISHMETQWQLPNGFTMNPRLSNDLDYVTAEVKVAISIAFGDHGLGEKEFTSENPFFVTIVNTRESPLSAKDLEKKIGDMIRKEYPKFADKIRIETTNVV
jgi:hypothetical protein